MYNSIRPYLFRLDPEHAHALTLHALRITGNFAPSRWIMEQLFKSPPKPVEAFGLTFRNPVGIAAGYDKDGVAIRGLAALGFGHVEIGTVTPRPQPGNPSPRVFRLVEDEAVINRMGFPSKGSEFMQLKLNPSLRSGLFERIYGIQPRNQKRFINSIHRGGAMLGINLGKNKDTSNEEAVFDYVSLVDVFSKYADYLTINISSPNTAGLRELQGRAALENLLSHLHQQRLVSQKLHEKNLPILVKLAPDLSEAELDDAIEAILRTKMDGVIVTNTTLARDGLRSNLRGETGGLSGSPLKGRSEAVLHQTVKRVNGEIPIVSAGGIMTPQDAKRRLDMGAALVQVYTGLIYRGPGLVKEILRHI
ncbi:quinone-dependent dihydroorotate dehydrogenase [Candidatus Villigracilis affinis]|uniref:quinone-dependent dihydroorotate dehydrogenase n=1 Tax=Candidatus Villigracilis affinis TaxID=3140682 RepID=UPI001DCE074F|nr:quinone-dependent dihydroorotate dehydrogenase [Anaerolineales bacterium]MBL0347399.1 quinone-dependent dihydroorotate dehydrogenase [Anaerolineales bacterium]